MNDIVMSLDDGFARYDNNIGLFFYNYKDGLIYAISDKSIAPCLDIIDDNEILKITIQKIVSSYQLCGDQLLPSPESWPGGPQEKLQKPLVINWLITNKCTHKCYYCYASDVINNETFDSCEKPHEEVAKNILSQNPLAVVISGGEPLLSGNIKSIIENLVGYTGIIIDTNGFCTNEIEKLIPIIKENNIHIRVSLDTLRIKESSKTRPANTKIPDEQNLGRTIDTVNLLLKHDIFFTVQTVLTKRNANNLIAMGDKLWLMGIKTWRIFELQENPRIKEYSDLLIFEGSQDNIRRQKAYFFEEFKSKGSRKWEGMLVKNTPALGHMNNVILVLPDGKFYVQGKNNVGKVLIDKENPFTPSDSAYFAISWGAHFDRYVGLIM